ncbi:zinc finger BED domain-containing protein 1-like, partial [Aplysia californica]|uniref:Zinc finger BED domain-containing protein 1-like n=1 Tax=Aplysia californica TaxID=6500 RepID=A0ABM0KBH3_APLCA
MATCRKNASDIWNFMTRTSPTTVACNLCQCIFNHTTGSTSNLRRHLQVKHLSMTGPKPLEKNDESVMKETPRRPGSMTQPTLLTTISNVSKYGADSIKKKALDDLLLEMITRDLQPFSIVEDRGFRGFVRGLDPRYELPSRRTLSRDLLPRKFQAEEQKLKASLESVTHVAITTDLWTSRQTESYITVTAHYFLPLPSWDLQSAVLTTQRVTVDHTAANIAKVLTDIFHHWGIEDKISSIVTDNASTMVSLVKDHLKKHHVRCFAHSLNLIVRDALKNSGELVELITKVKSVVSFFHHSVKATEKLLSFQQNLGRQQRKLIQDVDTRWNSTLHMLRRYEEEHTAVTGALCALSKTTMSLTDAEVDRIRAAIEVLTPFELATKEASTEKHTSLSKMLPTVRQIQEKLSGESSSALRDQLQAELRRRFGSLEDNFTLGAATLLDPRFRRLPFCDQSSAKNVEDRLVSMMQRSEPQQTSATEASQEVNNDGPPAQKKSLWDTYMKKVEQLKKTASPGLTGPYVEMRRYHESEFLSMMEDPVQWWRENCSNFPRLSTLARQFLHIPAT